MNSKYLDIAFDCVKHFHPATQLVLLYVCAHCNTDGQLQISHASLAEELGLAILTVHGAVKNLKSAKIFTVDRDCGSTPSVFTVQMHELVKLGAQ